MIDENTNFRFDEWTGTSTDRVKDVSRVWLSVFGSGPVWFSDSRVLRLSEISRCPYLRQLAFLDPFPILICTRTKCVARLFFERLEFCIFRGSITP